MIRHRDAHFLHHLARAGVAAALLAAPAAANPQGARGAGIGDFVARVDVLHPPAGPKLSGIENPAISVAAMDLYDRATVDGGLYRFNARMDILSNRAGEAASRTQVGRDAGMRVLMTAVGTPQWNATSAPPGEPFWDLPPYARSVPADMHAWAQDLVDLLVEMRDKYGALPDCVEIWNEPERPEWWSGDRNQFQELFGIAAATVKAALPGVKVGGPGLASARSTMAGEETLLLDLLDHAAATPHPLDFLSWHHYDIASGLRYQGIAQALRGRAAALGLPPVELFVSEFNIYPGVYNNPFSAEFDGSHAAAQLLGVLASVVELDLGGSAFFMAQDVEPGSGILDLTGQGQGCLSRRGVKKPVFRVLEFLNGMALEQWVQVDYPQSEWAVTVFATRSGNRVRFAAGNDVVSGQWVWSNGCRERGAEPGRLWTATSALLNAGRAVTYNNLVGQGLAGWEADVVLQVMPLAQEADAISRAPRTVKIQIQGAGNPQPVVAYRFDAAHNAPAARRAELLPMLEWIEAEARRLAYEAAAAYLADNGVQVPPYDPHARYPSTPSELAAALGISQYLAIETIATYNRALEEARLAHADTLNGLPAASLLPELPADAGVRYEAGAVSVTLQPNSVTVFDLRL